MMSYPGCERVGNITTGYYINQIMIGKSHTGFLALVGSMQLQMISKHNSECSLYTKSPYWKLSVMLQIMPVVQL